jgi:hypothetical protein
MLSGKTIKNNLAHHCSTNNKNKKAFASIGLLQKLKNED